MHANSILPLKTSLYGCMSTLFVLTICWAYVVVSFQNNKTLKVTCSGKRQLRNFLSFLSGTRGHVYIKLASDMDDATASKAQDIVVKGINENEEGSDAAKQVHRFLQ